MEDTPQIFLSYATKDRPFINNLSDRLNREGFKTWIDHKDILPGERWLPAIKRAIAESTFFLACLSDNSLGRRGVLQREVKDALELTKEILDEDIFLIPVWIGSGLPPDTLPDQLRELQWVNLSLPESDGMAKLLRSLRTQLKRLGRSGSITGGASVGTREAPIQGIEFPVDTFSAELKRRADEQDLESATALVHELVTYLRSTDYSFPAREASRILRHLQKNRWLQLRRMVSEALLQAGQRDVFVRCKYIESLVDDGNLYAARELLDRFRSGTSGEVPMGAAIHTLCGDVHARQYLNARVSSGERIQGSLREAVRHYISAYALNREWHLEPGIRTVALLCRAQRDNVELADLPNPVELGGEILEQIHDREEFQGPVTMSDCSVAVEACLALNNAAAAAEWLRRVVERPGRDTFEMAKLHRNLVEVWELDTYSEAGAALLSPLRKHLLLAGDGNDAEAVLLEDAKAGSTVDKIKLEKVLGRTPFRYRAWWECGLERARGVAVIRVAGQGYGSATGFVVRGGDLHPSLGEEMVFLTAAYVITTEEISATLPYQTIPAADARIVFSAVDKDREYGVREVLWSSPPEALDTTVVRLDGAVEGVVPYPIAKRVPLVRSDIGMLIIGHPAGGGLAFSTDDNQLLGHRPPLLHYRTPTEPGSGGSPVFNESWQLVGLHHAGSNAMPRLDGPGTYAANEGIWIQSIIEALAAHLETGPGSDTASHAERLQPG